MGKQGVEVINKIAVTAGQITPPKRSVKRSTAQSYRNHGQTRPVGDNIGEIIWRMAETVAITGSFQ